MVESVEQFKNYTKYSNSECPVVELTKSVIPSKIFLFKIFINYFEVNLLNKWAL